MRHRKIYFAITEDQQNAKIVKLAETVFYTLSLVETIEQTVIRQDSLG